MRTDARSITVAAAIAAALLTRADVTRACGEEFDVELLSQRTSTLLELQPGVFLSDASTLVPAPARPFTVTSDPEPEGVRERGGVEERALYERGARAFAAADHDAARAAFTALLALPRDQRRHRSTWAAYMLGRIAQGDQAIAAYRQVRSLASDGFLDELGLAASSLGQEARIHYDATDVAAAVRLYAEQAAHGDPTGATSLLFVARTQAIRAEGRRALLADPVGQRLLATYLFTRADELAEDQRGQLWHALTEVRAISGADRLAAAAYREGRWELAERLARQDAQAPRSKWVLAKLALRAGDDATAERLLAEASSAMAVCDEHDHVAREARARVQSERTIVALSGGHSIFAMALAWEARRTYPTDTAYVAERVLTIDELRGFVDTLPWSTEDPDEEDWSITAASLRHLLARRLMRAERFSEAAPYFTPERRVIAQQYATAIERGRGDGDRIERARALFEASGLARRHGLELLGTEHAPDWAIHGASFDRRGFDGEPELDDPRMTAGERARVAASAPSHPRRYHYRYLASALAEEAADLLPHQSHAFAATLCHATRYIFLIDEERKDALYTRYLREGPSVEFASSFGQTCPVPELERARRFLPAPPSRLPIVVGFLVLGLCALAGLTTYVGSHARRRGAIW